jgi:hypothetical protein
MRKSTPPSCAASAPPRYRGSLSLFDTPSASRHLQLRAEQRRQAFEVEDPADQVRLLPDAERPASPEPAQPMPVLALAEEFLDLLAGPLGQPVPHAPRAHPDARMRRLLAVGIHRDVGFDAPPEQRLNESGGEETRVPAQGGGGEAEPTFGPRAALAAEVDRPVPRILGTDRVPPIVGAQAPLVLLGIEGLFQGDKTLLAGVRPDQGALGTHVATHQAFGQRPLHRTAAPAGRPRQTAGAGSG